MLSDLLPIRRIWGTLFPRLIYVCLAFFLYFSTSPVAAETKTITATGDYTMGEGETMLIAKERAVTVAMRNAVEQAGVYLESLSQIKNLQLTKDEVTVVGAGAIEILDKQFDEPKFQSGSAYFHVTITARVNIDSIDSLRSRLRDKSSMDYKKILTDYIRLQNKVEELKQQLAAASTEQTKRKIQTEIAQNEQAFSSVQWFEKGYVYHSRQEFDNAIMAYTKAIVLNPQNTSAYYNRGNVYSAKGLYDRAIADLDQAIALDSQNAFYFYNRGNAYGKKGLFDQAILNYSQAITLNPQYANTYFNKAVVFEKSNQPANAVQAYRQFLVYAPPQDPYIDRAKQRIAALGGS